MATRTVTSAHYAVDSFIPRHLGPNTSEQQAMLATLGYSTLDEFIDAVVPEAIRFRGTLATGAEHSEPEVLNALSKMAAKNRIHRSFIVQVDNIAEIQQYEKESYVVILKDKDKTKLKVSKTGYKKIKEVLHF